MTPSRFTFETAETPVDVLPGSNGFLLMSVAAQAAPCEPQSAMQWLYQRLYEEAARASQPQPKRDLFSVMN